jgi:hypothetical protein
MVPGNRTFECVRIESDELYFDALKKGWRIVPKTVRRIEPCSAGIYPGRNYHVYIRMVATDDTGTILSVHDLPPYYVFLAPAPIQPKAPTMTVTVARSGLPLGSPTG